MTCPQSRMQLHTCQADGACCRPPRFQARLEAANGTDSVLKNSEACVDHLGDMVQDLTVWARVHHLTDGQLTVARQKSTGHRIATCHRTPPTTKARTC